MCLGCDTFSSNYKRKERRSCIHVVFRSVQRRYRGADVVTEGPYAGLATMVLSERLSASQSQHWIPRLVYLGLCFLIEVKGARGETRLGRFPQFRPAPLGVDVPRGGGSPLGLKRIYGFT